jgi:(p)ppGpp synthase/HD superfamily hydrolase
MDIVERARVFATAAHAAVKQVRKYTGEPYVNHPAAVAKIVESVPHTPEMLAAAFLHDVVEDTGITLDLIRAEFGDHVADLVYWLTDQSTLEDGNREIRKAIDRAHSAAASAEAQTIKVADLIDNTLTIRDRDPGFYRTHYFREKQLLLDAMTRADPGMKARALAQIADDSKKDEEDGKSG